MGHGYLQHLSDDDLALLARAAAEGGGRPGMGAVALRARPDEIEARLRSPAAFDAVFGPATRSEPFLGGSPFLTFAVAVQRGAAELRGARFVEEWLGPRLRVPVLDPAGLREFVASPARRLFLSELLASYTHVVSGSTWVHTRRGWRRRRFSELDPVRLASLLEVVPDDERAGVYRRLGDLALFLTGVFPDHTAASGLHPLAEARLLRAGGLSGGRRPGPGGHQPLSTGAAVALLEELGQRWYRLACASAPVPLTMGMEVVEEVSARFGEARRVLNYLTDRFLFPFRGAWFGAPPA